MERRRDDRIRRRIPVSYWQPGENTHRHKGFTTDVSVSGMYIATAHPIAQGRRVRVEIGAERGFLIEGQVTHAFKTDPLVPSPRRAGMGVRFLPIRQLLGKLVPEIAAAAEPSEAVKEEGVYRAFYENRDSFLEVYRRDLATGGLFVATDHPAQVDEVIVVELVIAGSGQPPLRFEGKVVYRVEPTTPGDDAAPNLMAGMGIELVDFQATSAKLASLAERLTR